MSLFRLSNDVQCSEALIRIKRLAEYTGYTILQNMSLFRLSNDVQCSEALIRIKRLAEYTGYTIPQTADHRLQTAD